MRAFEAVSVAFYGLVPDGTVEAFRVGHVVHWACPEVTCATISLDGEVMEVTDSNGSKVCFPWSRVVRAWPKKQAP